ncbi:MAG TPA: DUF4139 domain-containing protein [Labilithrix sp.]
MRKILLCGAALALVGCGSQTTSYVKSETTLGRVVVYRNGVAYFERYADVQGDSLKLTVPQDKVDDFLKSLTVVDAQTGEPAPISYPSVGTGGGTIDMKIGVASGKPRKLRLSYVTEAPSWKPTYRVVVDKSGKVDLQGWAIVDNTSGEDWRDVKLGVGASSAMSFRYDLKGLRVVQRETLQQNDLFALAPPTGGASFGAQTQDGRKRVVADITDDMLQKNEGDAAPATGQRVAANANQEMAKPGPRVMSKAAAPTEPRPQLDAFQQMAQGLRGGEHNVVIEGYANVADKDKMTASLERANRLRDQLVRRGVDPNRITAIGKGEVQGRNGGARVVDAPNDDGKKPGKDGEEKETSGAVAAVTQTTSGEPIGTSHFESGVAMTVPRGTSAMVSILRSQTDGEVVYLYDPESARGNTQYPFKTVRFKNPTDSALESGPVSVFGEGRFVGEGLAEPIPARSIAFVPFALDRQIVVERKDDEKDAIAKILTVNRGVFSTEIKHTKRASFTLYNRMGEKATVYLRHTVAPGYKLTKAPEKSDGDERLGGARLFRVEIEPNGKLDVAIEESTPVFRSTDIRSPAGLDLVRAYLSSDALDAGLKDKVGKLLELNTEMAKVEQQIQTTHEQMAEYRQRMDELHTQIFTLKAVKTAGPLMAHLEKKLQEMSEKLSKATVDVVTLQEKQMVARIAFQNGVGDLTLDADPKAKATAYK